METILYRNTKLDVKTIPKGTLLFRLTKKKNEDELRGIKIEEGKRCINSNHNVFFYPNPFIAKSSLKTWSANSKIMRVYVLIKDVKVLWLLNPSKYSRVTKNTKRTFIKRCSLVNKGCLPHKPTGMLAAYNPCVSDTLIKKYPDIVGIINNSVADSERVKQALKHKTMKNKLKYLNTASDAMGITSIPELILHPLAKRPANYVYVSDNDTLENNYKLLKNFSTDDEKSMILFMEEHSEYDPETFFFKYKK